MFPGRPAPSSFPLHIGAFSPFPPTGTAGLTPSPPSGSLMSSTSVPMRECHPSKAGTKEGACPVVPGLFSAASCMLGLEAQSCPKGLFQPSFLWNPLGTGGSAPAPSPRPPRPKTPRTRIRHVPPSPSTHPLSWNPLTECWALLLHLHCRCPNHSLQPHVAGCLATP